MNQICSFTGYALLNSWALDILSPSSHHKMVPNTIEPSLFKTLNSDFNKMDFQQPNNSMWYKAYRFYLITPLQVAYISLMNLTVSRIGAVVNGMLTLISYLRYQLASPEHVEETWNKTTRYAFATFSDTACAIGGSAIAKYILESAIYFLHVSRIISIGNRCSLNLKDSLTEGAIAITFMAVGAALLTQLLTPYYASQFFAPPYERVGLCCSLFLRKEFGMVDAQGNLLPYSEEDKVTCSTLETRISVDDHPLTNLILILESELIQTIQKCNQILSKTQQALPFEYPFDGNAIAQKLDKIPLQADTLPSPLVALSKKCRQLQFQIQPFIEAYDQAIRVTYDDSYPVQLLKQCFNVPIQKLSLPKRKTLLTQEYYQYLFQLYALPPISSAPFTDVWTDMWNDKRCECLHPKKDPTLPQVPTDLRQKFKYYVQLNLWKSQQKQLTMPYRDVLGLQNNASKEDYRKLKRKYALALHPDKNLSATIEYGALFKAFNLICASCDEEFGI